MRSRIVFGGPMVYGGQSPELWNEDGEERDEGAEPYLSFVEFI